MTSALKILTHVVWLEGFVKTRQDHFNAVVNLGSSETDTIVKVCQYVTGIYHINYGVIQGFLTFRKAVKAHVKKYRIFLRVFDIANQLLTLQSHFAPVGQVDERSAKPSPSCRQWRSNFPRKGREPKCRKNNRKIRIQGLWWWNFSRGRERKSTTGRLASGRFWPCIREFCILKIMPMVCFCGVPTHFSRWALAPTNFTILIWRFSIFFFSFINKVDYSLSVKSYCVYMINIIIHGCL